MKIRILFTILIIGVISSVMYGCSSSSQENSETELLISAAASMTDVLKEISEAYSLVEPDVNLIYTFGGSGALQTQIEEGAPADIFISAAQKQMTALEEGGHILSETKKTLLVNKVVLIAPVNSEITISFFEELSRDDIKKLGLGDPSSVPVGQYSEEIFKSLSILDEVKEKSIYGSDVRTVLTWVESGEVDLGVVYSTDAIGSNKVKIVAEAPIGSHEEVSYPVAVIKDSKNIEEAKKLLDYLSSDKAAKIFEKYGFEMK